MGKHDAKLLDEHLSSVAFEAWLKTLMSPCARGPGVSAMGGAGVGDGEREVGSVALGMMLYEWGGMREDWFSNICSWSRWDARACPAVFTFKYAIRIRTSFTMADQRRLSTMHFSSITLSNSN